MVASSRLRVGRMAVVGILVAAFGCSSRQPAEYEEVSLSETTFSFDVPTANYDIFTTYALVPGDVLDVLYHVDQKQTKGDFCIEPDYELTVKFPDVPELTETQIVRPDGTISLPYLGVVVVGGKTVAELTTELQARYRDLAAGEFKIAADHLLTVKFVELPELNESQVVRPDGTVSLPYLGVVEVGGKTVAQLTDELKDKYIKVLKKAEIYVLVSEQQATWNELRKRLRTANLHIIVNRFREAIKEFKQDLHTAPRGLSRLVTVRPDGYATFALVGDMFVSGKTVPEVDKALDERYLEVLQGLSVDVFLEAHAGAQIYVLGNVENPGSYPISKPTPVIKALALAGSYLPGSDLGEVVIFRRHENKLVATRINVDAVLEMEGGSREFYVQPDDLVYVPRTGLAKTAEIMQDIAKVLNFRGWTTDPVREAREYGK